SRLPKQGFFILSSENSDQDQFRSNNRPQGVFSEIRYYLDGRGVNGPGWTDEYGYGSIASRLGMGTWE
ncbi:MAG: hypothetical protein MUO67_21330, partial [Anaerolineales bacterium]|nr:hypothetical protein [Anaerolineales bacterium]